MLSFECYPCRAVLPVSGQGFLRNMAGGTGVAIDGIPGTSRFGTGAGVAFDRRTRE